MMMEAVEFVAIAAVVVTVGAIYDRRKPRLVLPTRWDGGDQAHKVFGLSRGDRQIILHHAQMTGTGMGESALLIASELGEPLDTGSWKMIEYKQPLATRRYSRRERLVFRAYAVWWAMLAVRDDIRSSFQGWD